MSLEDPKSRLRNINGHINGVIRMIDEDAYCIDVIHQIQAVEAALKKVSSLILENHLNSCVIKAINGKDADERQKVLKEILDIFDHQQKSN